MTSIIVIAIRSSSKSPVQEAIIYLDLWYATMGYGRNNKETNAIKVHVVASNDSLID